MMTQAEKGIRSAGEGQERIIDGLEETQRFRDELGQQDHRCMPTTQADSPVQIHTKRVEAEQAL